MQECVRAEKMGAFIFIRENITTSNPIGIYSACLLIFACLIVQNRTVHSTRSRCVIVRGGIGGSLAPQEEPCPFRGKIWMKLFDFNRGLLFLRHRKQGVCRYCPGRVRRRDGVGRAWGQHLDALGVLFGAFLVLKETSPYILRWIVSKELDYVTSGAWFIALRAP